MLIPACWTVPVVALTLGCDEAEAGEFVADHPDDLLAAVEAELLRRDLARSLRLWAK